MARYDDAYSRIVAWLKLALPLLALAILSTLFLVSREVDLERTTMLDTDAGAGRGVEAMQSPSYAGMTRDGAAVAIRAELAWPNEDSPTLLNAETVEATFDLPDGEVADISAREGVLDNANDTLTLFGDVQIDTGSGWSMRTETLEARLDWTQFDSPVSVTTEGPIGTLQAGNMTIARDTMDDSPYLMTFDGGVHLVYLP